MKKIYLLITMTLMLFSTQTYADLSVLVVHDNTAGTDRIEVIKTAISNSGFTYTLYDAVVEGAGPSLELLNGFDLVIWYTGNDYAGLFFWEAADIDNEAIKSYIDSGGMMWVQGLDFMHDRYPDAPIDFVAGDFVYDYMGISQYFAQSHYDDGFFSDGVIQLDLVADNDIFTLDPLTWIYETMWAVDALLPTNNGSGLYAMGPDGYDFEDYYSVIYNEVGDGKFLSCAFETARFDTQETCDAFIGEGLAYFEQFSSGDAVAVEEITVTGEGDATTIEVDGGSLQMYAAILPEDATNQAVFWSIVPGTAYASVSSTGLLTASGTDIGNGNCWIKATSADGTAVVDSIEIIISNQTNNPAFEVLLVNDNDRFSSRYLRLDTVLSNIEAIYDVYNIAETNAAPNLGVLSAYDLVIWYAGTDGVALKLWDVSDTNNYKFNEDLISYINMKGNVWLQGLDFMYDVFGGAPDSFTSGQFIYDVMGISVYAAQATVDDDGIGCPSLDIISNDVTEFTPITWADEDGSEIMKYVDGFELTSNATPMYKIGPVGHPLDNLATAFYTHNSGKGIVMSWAVETYRINTLENSETLFTDVLNYVEENSGTGIQDWTTETAVISAIYPNPAHDIATLNYNLLNSANVQFNLLDITGRTIYSENLGQQATGSHNIEISKNEMNIKNGVYLYTLTIDKQQFTGKVIFN